MELTLTREADALICLIYKEFLQRRKDGTSRENAKNFGSDHSIQKKIAPKWSVEDVEDLCRELSRNNLMDCHYADNHAIIALLSDSGIAYMEGRFKRGLESVLEYIRTICDFIPI